MTKNENGTEIEISLEEASIVQHQANQTNSLSNCYLIKVFNTVTKFYNFSLTNYKQEVKESSLANLKENKCKSGISPKTKKRVTRCLYAWKNIIKCYNDQNKKLGIRDQKRLIMVTVTLPVKQMHDDQYIKRNILGYYLEMLNRRCKVYNYFWRAEPQENGNIHFHIIIDVFVPYQTIKDYWNHALSLHGYLDEYRRQTGRENPPSTHVKDISGSDEELQYSLKYTLKTEEKRQIEGYKFGYSDSLRNIYTPIIKMSEELKLVLNKLEARENVSVLVDEYYSTYSIKPKTSAPFEMAYLDTILLKEYEVQVDILY
jgi:hypothetical protein